MSSDRIAVLAHELRSPVAALTALAERARTTLPDGALERIVALAIDGAGDIVRLLTDPDLLSLRTVAVDLSDVLAEVEQPEVIVRAESATIVCDPTRVRQAVRNLVANGLRHGTCVVVEARVEGNAAVIQVRDDGPGIDPIFDPFARGVSGAGSSGYGLWLARAIAEAHGGRLELLSAPGQGAAFTLVLPLASHESG